MNDITVEITESAEHGVILKCSDIEVPDEFEDFLTEKCYVLFQTKLDSDEVTFFFGQASSDFKVRELYKRFIDHYKDGKL